MITLGAYLKVSVSKRGKCEREKRERESKRVKRVKESQRKLEGSRKRVKESQRDVTYTLYSGMVLNVLYVYIHDPLSICFPITSHQPINP